jgi:hypothetical protein
MRNISDINFSLIIPTRDRFDLLKENVPTYFKMAKNPSKIEMILITDFDDPSNIDILSLLSSTPNTYLISQHRTGYLIRDYNNRGSQMSTGKYIWILNDECEMTTYHWDEILVNKMENFLSDKPDRLLYTLINDDTHYSAGVQHLAGCCFPILTKEAVDCINGIMPPEINAHGADYAIYHIFKSAMRPRVLDCFEVALIDHSSNNHFGSYKHKRKNPDTTQKSIDCSSSVTQLNQKQYDYYIALLNKEISKYL